MGPDFWAEASQTDTGSIFAPIVPDERVRRGAKKQTGLDLSHKVRRLAQTLRAPDAFPSLVMIRIAPAGPIRNSILIINKYPLRRFEPNFFISLSPPHSLQRPPPRPHRPLDLPPPVLCAQKRRPGLPWRWVDSTLPHPTPEGWVFIFSRDTDCIVWGYISRMR